MNDWKREENEIFLLWDEEDLDEIDLVLLD